jgi:hypothetical protein
VERGSHRLWLNDHELQGFNTSLARDLFATTLSHIWDEGAEAALGVEKDITDATT